MLESIALDVDKLHVEINESMERIPEALADRIGVFAHFNKGGSKPPLFWCFNNWAEAIFLAHRLAPDRPLFAMRSFHGFIKGKHAKRANAVGFAETYAEQVLEHVGTGPLLIGGNCQAAPIAEAMAHILIGRTGRKPLLVTLEHLPIYSYPGDILMLFGAESEKYNPFLQGKDPVPAWRAQHARAAWGIIGGEHGKYFMEPAVLDLVSYIQQACEIHADGIGLPSGSLSP